MHLKNFNLSAEHIFNTKPITLMTKINVFIHSGALCDPQQQPREYLCRGLGKLTEAGLSITIDEAAPESIRMVLNREKIDYQLSSSPRSNAGWVVKSEDGQLSLHHTEKQKSEAFPGWEQLTHRMVYPERKAAVVRNTKETRIEAEVNLDGTGKYDIKTGLGFFDHMLEQIARHGKVDLKLHCDGDLHIDEHHTIEDSALALGEAIHKALRNKAGITRYASVLPMDETRAMVALDLSGRPYLVFDAEFSREKVGDVPTEMIKHFWYSLAMTTKSTLHIEVQGENDHHKIEAVFKGFAVVLREAVKRSGSMEIPSSKGVL